MPDSDNPFLKYVQPQQRTADNPFAKYGQDTAGDGTQSKQDDAPDRPSDSSASLGTLFRAFLHDINPLANLQVARAKAPQIGQDIADTSRELLGDVRDWRAHPGAIATVLNPLAGPRESAQAGGQVLDKIGDVAAFATGGFAGPEVPPAGREIRNAPKSIVAPAESSVPLSATRPLPSAAARPPAAGGGLPALPPPTVTAAGHPWTSTGTGMIPPGPMSTTTRPSVTPGPVSPTRPTPSPRIENAATPAASPLATALAKGDAGAVDRELTKQFRQAVRPATLRIGRASAINAEDGAITSAVDSIIANKNNLRLTGPSGEALPEGSLPQSLHQFSEGIEQTKEALFNEYDNMAQRAGGAGVRVSLQPAVAALQQAVAEARLSNPSLAHQAQEFAELWTREGSLSPSQMQKLIQQLNAEYGQITSGTREIINQKSLVQRVLPVMRESLDNAIASSQGPGYAPLKKRYADLLSIERNVANAVQRHARNTPGGLGGVIVDRAAAVALLHGFVTLNPATIGTAAAVKGGELAVRYLRSPNRAVKLMFQQRARPTVQRIAIPGASFPAAQAVGQVGFAAGQRPDNPSLTTTPPPR